MLAVAGGTVLAGGGGGVGGGGGGVVGAGVVGACVGAAVVGAVAALDVEAAAAMGAVVEMPAATAVGEPTPEVLDEPHDVLKISANSTPAAAIRASVRLTRSLRPLEARTRRSQPLFISFEGDDGSLARHGSR